MIKLTEVQFANEFVGQFPGDTSDQNFPRQTPGVMYSTVLPTPVSSPRLIAWSEEMGRLLNISRPLSQEEVDLLAGNHVSSSMNPYAACYAGHQFGNWAGQLGDGRAITLGELPDTSGQSWELQLKGAGPTPYSRRADGRAVLRSSVREYLMSEAMHHLGVPTTRALSLVSTGDRVMRDMFYDGHPEFEPGAIVSRVAPTFLRFGNFEMPAARREKENLHRLIEWTIARYFPAISGADKVLHWFREVVERTAFLITEWLRVGFVHGVMNTDNMSILGLTIDYGPYSFVDEYDPEFTPNTTDLPGRRYAFGRQAAIAKWNLGCLAGAIAVIHEQTDDLVKILDEYDEFFSSKFYHMMANKMGLDSVEKDLTGELEKFMISAKPDMTLFYQLLMQVPEESLSIEEVLEHFRDSFYREPQKKHAEMLNSFISNYQDRLRRNQISRHESLLRMTNSNPRFILRNYLLHEAIENLQEGNEVLFRKLEHALKEPYSQKFDEFLSKRPEWARTKAGCSMLSCSS